MNFSDDWRSVFPVCSVFSPPSLLPSPPPSTGPLLFAPLPPPLPLLSFPLSPPPPSPPRLLYPTLRSFLRSTSSLPSPLLDSLSLSLLSPPSPPFPSPPNLLAVLRLGPSSLVLFFPYGSNAHQIGFLPLTLPVSSSPPSPPLVQKDGFRHPTHRIRQLSAAAAASSSWSPQPGGVGGFLLAATLYSVNWFRIECGVPDVPALVPAAKQGFDAAVVRACWSLHFSSECAVLLENGTLCWFDLHSRRGGRMRVTFGGDDDPGEWLSCEYGAQPWMVIVASSKAVSLVDLRYGERGQFKVLAKIGMPGLFETEPFVRRRDQYLAFCKAGFDNYQMSVVTERHVMLLDVRRPLIPVLTWEHGLEAPSHVAMFKLSELRPSKEYEWASESGFAILVGSFLNGEFGLFCYGPKEQDYVANSPLYAWELPSRLSLIGRCCNSSDDVMKEVFSKDDAMYNSIFQQSKDSVIGYYILPNNQPVSEPCFSGFALIRLMASGKLEMQRYRASWDLFDDMPCNERQHMPSSSGLSICTNCPKENLSTSCDFLKLSFLHEHLRGNLCSLLAMHNSKSSKEMNEIVIPEDVADLAKDYQKSSSSSVLDIVSDTSIPMSIFEIACRSVLSSLPLVLLPITFSRYNDMLANCREVSLEFLELPSCLSHNKLQPFLLSKPSSRGEKCSSRALPALVGPVLPIPVLLALRETNKDIESSSSQRDITDADFATHQCREVLEAVFPEISIADTSNCNGWSASQELSDEKSFFVYEPQTQSGSICNGTSMEKETEQQKLEDPFMSQTSAAPHQDENFTTFVCGKARYPDSESELSASNLFDFSPVRLDFDSPSIVVQPAEENMYKCLKRQFSKWQNNFKPYQNFCTSYKLPKTI